MGVSVLLPLIMLCTFIFLKIPIKKAIYESIKLGVGFQGIILIINAYVAFITPVFDKMLKLGGINLPYLDIGWAPTMITSYATTLGVLYIGIGIFLQLFLFFIRWTNVLQITDIVNIYSYPFWGLITYKITGNFYMSILVMIVINLYTITISEIIVKRWSHYYKIPDGTCAIPHEVGTIPVSIIGVLLLNKLKLGKINISTATLQKKWGFFGEPLFLGFFSGAIIGILANFKNIYTVNAFVEILKVGMATGAVAVVFPKAASLIGEVFGILAENIKSWTVKNGSKRQIYFAVNDAVGFGEPNNFITALIAAPLLILLAFILPGNKVMPLVDLVGVAYTINIISALTKGNIFKSLICVLFYYSLGFYVGTYISPVYTDIVRSAGEVNVPAHPIISLNTLCKPFIFIIAYPFMKSSYVGITFITLLYLVLWTLVKKYKYKLENFIENNL
jgi:PTS system galactitol-specific IIC component